jgi:xylulokinase
MRQILADVVRIPVITNASDNGAAYGAALLAAVNAGIFENIEVACEKMINLKNLDKPQLENQDRYNLSYEVFRDLYLKLKPVFKKAAFLMSDIQPV